MFRDVTFDFRGRVAIVTGVGSPTGIGRAILRGLADAGATVAGCDVDEAAVADVAREIPGGHFAAVDVRSPAAVRAFVGETRRRFGNLHYLVNNAGIAPFGRLADLPVETFDATFDVNVRGQFLAAQAFVNVAAGLPRIPRAIVNVSSISVHKSGELKAHYVASKAAVGSLTKGMALEFSRFGIRVNAVEPGTIDTGIVAGQADIQKLVDDARGNPGLPINRLGKGDDLAGAALFLLSDAAAYITGAAILVDGGELAGGLLPSQEGR